MKLIQNKLYLLLIDEEAEIKDGMITLYENLNTVNENFQQDDSGSDCFVKHYNSKIIAYFPLTNEAKELDLPLLPNPFKGEVDTVENNLKQLLKYFSEKVLETGDHFYTGKCAGLGEALQVYKAAQPKQLANFIEHFNELWKKFGSQ